MIIEILRHTIMITAFVLVMMLIIEYINVQTRGSWISPLQKKGWLQIILAAVLGVIPGCLGTYTAVSLYSHKIFSFAALVTVMIATAGDEAFIMLSVIPNSALILFAIITGVAIVTGFILYAFMGNKTLMKLPENHLRLHEGETNCICFDPKGIVKQFKRISFQRAILIVGILLFLFGLVTGQFTHSHNIIPTEQIEMNHDHAQHDHSIADDSHDHSPATSDAHAGHEHHGDWNWISTTFLVVSLIALFIISTVNDHFFGRTPMGTHHQKTLPKNIFMDPGSPHCHPAADKSSRHQPLDGTKHVNHFINRRFNRYYSRIGATLYFRFIIRPGKYSDQHINCQFNCTGRARSFTPVGRI